MKRLAFVVLILSITAPSVRASKITSARVTLVPHHLVFRALLNEERMWQVGCTYEISDQSSLAALDRLTKEGLIKQGEGNSIGEPRSGIIFIHSDGSKSKIIMEDPAIGYAYVNALHDGNAIRLSNNFPKKLLEWSKVAKTDRKPYGGCVF